MIHFKNKSGFTLVETVIAVAIMALTVTPMFVLETNVFNAVVRWGEQFNRLLFAKAYIYTAVEKESPGSTDYSVEKKEDNPLSMVRYTRKPVSKKSALASIKNLYWQESVASGLASASPQARIVSFVFKPPVHKS